jgi:hypothetical protein
MFSERCGVGFDVKFTMIWRLEIGMNAVGNVPDFPSTFYVDVCDSADAPKVFVHEAAALGWVAEHHPGWKVDNEPDRV